MSNLAAAVGDAAAEYPDRVAVAYDGDQQSYETLWRRTGAFASGLTEAGVGAGDRVALYLPNLPQFVVAFHGTLRAGGVVVPINPQYKTRELAHLLASSEARVVVTLPDLVPLVEAVADDAAVEEVVALGPAEGATPWPAFLGDAGFDTVARDDDAVACQPYTSGTTGRPKGVLLTHENLRANAEMSAELPPGGIGPEDSHLGVLPLFHIYGMTVVMNATLVAGGSYYPLPSWDPGEAMALVERAGLTLMHGVPAMYNDVVNLPEDESYDLSTLRLCGAGGSGVPVEVLRAFERRYDATIYEGYGLTETSPVTHFNRPAVGRRVGSIGTPLPGVEARVVDDDFETVPPIAEGPVGDDRDLDAVTGELVVAGPVVMRGYDDRPEATAEAFTETDGRRWFHTGDLGYHDEDGYFYVVDRETHMILTGGYNVYPREVEELLFELPGVADAAVVGIPDERRGETVKAFVVRGPDADLDADDVRQHCLDGLAEYKHPREVEFVDELPRTTTGKVQKFELAGE
ncbi:MAG: long-chain fatty acid--CoA ligase [Halolamina sp.]